MFGMRLETAKASFFDREKVLKATTAANRRNLSRFGAFVRTRAISSMLGHPVRSFGVKSKVKNRKVTSAPGQPPNPHTSLLVRFIFFSFSPSVWGSDSVVIGPVRLGGQTGEALPALEYGGRSNVWDPVARRRKPVTIRPRPFMGPAFAAEQSKIGGLWANSVRG